MIRTWLKHMIYEICINEIFDGIQRNFQLANVDFSSFSVGDYVRVQVIFKDTQKTFTSCRVAYKHKGNVVIESYGETNLPLKLIMKNGNLQDITYEYKDDYGEFFE